MTELADIFSKEGIIILSLVLCVVGVYSLGYYHGSDEPQVVTERVEVCTCPEERTRIERGTDAVIRFLGDRGDRGDKDLREVVP